MDSLRLSADISDERCGLYFLAGLDTRPGGKHASTLTVHAARGAFTEENEAAIRSAVAASDPGLRVRISLHSGDALHRPESLECFARRFRHQQIVLDPTGAFERVQRLLALAADIRAAFGRAVSRILWQADRSALVVVADPRLTAPEVLRPRLEALVAHSAGADLRRAMRSVHVCTQAPTGRYTPVDAASIAAGPASLRAARALLRASGLAALMSFGALSAAPAHPFHGNGDESLPGIAALVGLTTLGENAYGARNRYQALGGLRLYFGEPFATSPAESPRVAASATAPGQEFDPAEEGVREAEGDPVHIPSPEGLSGDAGA